MAKTGQSEYRIVRGSTQGLADVETFLSTLSRSPDAHALFDQENDIFVGRAPGRLDVMGGIADYSGSLVLQLPIQQAALAAVQPNHLQSVEIVSLGNSENGRGNSSFSMLLNDLAPEGRPLEYGAAREYFRRNSAHEWAAYIAGVLLVLMHECDARCRGIRILLDSHVPEGKGVSSSAAIEVATMQAICAAFGIKLEPRTLALLCQKVENRVVGAPCGVMDQMTAASGEQDRLLKLLCQPADVQGSVEVPHEIAFWGIDSGVRHSVSGSDYSSVRVGAFMGYRIIADLAGLPVRASANTAQVEIRDARWNGYLANLTPAEFEQYRREIPEQMAGEEFLAKFHGTTDPVTRVDPQQTYATRQPTAHPVYENFRVRRFAELLVDSPGERQFEQLGELMYESHASYSACGLGSEGTDLLVDLVRARGPKNGLYGAKITGGGSGGAVAVLGRREARQAVSEIASAYATKTGCNAIVFGHSSPGAAGFGFLHLTCK
ncbi:MAG TPA: galactokinase family protein [Candidatus Sulfotelmatobacter sp.]|nr:galactokinase family protein [Candidatus Sulfotelmatobacter sp.]